MPKDTQQHLEPDLRAVLVGVGDTGSEIVLGEGSLFQQLPTHRKVFICLNTDATKGVLAPDLASQGVLLHVPIPAWARETAPASYDDHAAKRRFQHHDRPYLASAQGAQGRHEGALACIDARSRIRKTLLDAITRVGADRAENVMVHVLAVAFGGRGTGSGGLPVLLSLLSELRATLHGQVNLLVTVAVQLPTVRVEGAELYRRRAVALVAEIEALAEIGVESASDRMTGPYNGSYPWDDFLVFGSGGGDEGHARGVATDVSEAVRYAASVLLERISGEAGAALRRQAALRRPLLDGRDAGTALQRMFGATGMAELVYESEAAVEHAVQYLECAFYTALQ